MHTIYCFCNGGSPGWLNAMAMADDGHVLAQHCCSDIGFVPHDLGIGSDWKHNHYDEHFGAGNWTLEWVAEPLKHSGLLAAYALNQQLKAE